MSEDLEQKASELYENYRQHGCGVSLEHAIAQALKDVREADAKVARAHADKYPTDVFIEPPAGQHGQTVDACSARAMRYAARLIAEDILAQGEST